MQGKWTYLKSEGNAKIVKIKWDDGCVEYMYILYGRQECLPTLKECRKIARERQGL